LRAERDRKQQTEYRAVIIGAGRIGAGFDTPRSALVLTHAHALKTHPRTDLVGITDLDSTKGKKEARKWNTKFFSSVDIMLRDVEPDIVVIATPDDTHADMLMHVSAAKPRLIICEKPVATKRKDIERLRNMEKGSSTTIINFSRRFDPIVEGIAKKLESGSYGKILSASGIYTKGLFHNGSHIIDLARCFLGELKGASMIFHVDDCPNGESTIGGVATFTRCPQFYLMNGDARAYAAFEFEIFAETRHLRFAQEGLTLIERKVVPDPVYKGYRILGKATTRKCKLRSALPNLVAHAVEVLDGKRDPLSSLEEGIRTQEACLQLHDSFKRTS
jgi:predicted dehydrogenase